MTDVTVVDLGLGNIQSILSAFQRLGASVDRSSDPDRVARAERLVVPGQGAFRDGAAALGRGLGPVIIKALAKNTPLFGICLGMQLLFEGSEEAPETSGLGVLSGRVVRFGGRKKVPHMGWNEVRGLHPLLPEREWYYFVHSYFCVPSESSEVAGTADYDGSFCAAVARGNLFACQFHPEKSHRAGAELLRRFLDARAA